MKEILLRTVTLGIIYLVRTQNFPKSNISNPLIRTRTYAYQRVRNVSFSENFSYILNEWSPLGVLRIFRKKNSGQKPATFQKNAFITSIFGENLRKFSEDIFFKTCESLLLINPFYATGLFLYPLDTSKNLMFSVFSG